MVDKDGFVTCGTYPILIPTIQIDIGSDHLWVLTDEGSCYCGEMPAALHQSHKDVNR